jgi:hypothetical protein
MCKAVLIVVKKNKNKNKDMAKSPGIRDAEETAPCKPRASPPNSGQTRVFTIGAQCV